MNGLTVFPASDTGWHSFYSGYIYIYSVLIYKTAKVKRGWEIKAAWLLLLSQLKERIAGWYYEDRKSTEDFIDGTLLL